MAIETEAEAETFKSLSGLDARCLRVLETMGFSKPTPVQRAAIPIALKGSDLVATAQTGTGKTLAYMLPSLTRLAGEAGRHNRMLVLVPTRELCVQVEAVARDFARALHLKPVLVYGGVGMQQQTDQLRHGCDIIIATPGRLLDHMGRGAIRFNDLEILVFDEADRMLDMGFLPDIQRILAKLPVKRQTMMFSATFAPELERLTRNMMRDPERISIGPVARPVDAVRQLLIPVRQEEKSKILLELLGQEGEGQIETSIIFLRTKMRTDRLAKILRKEGHRAAPIHGDLTQSHREKALEGFRAGKYNILVATDVAARGLDIDDVTHVINYDIPLTADDYVHRIGRTARAQREGDAITFVCPSEIVALENIEKAIGRHLERVEYEGMPKVISTWKPAGASPRQARRGRGFFGRR